MNARNSILNRLRAAPINEAIARPDVASWFDRNTYKEHSKQRTARLRSALELVKTEVHEVSPENWPQTLLQIAAAKGLRHVLIGSDTPHGSQLEACAPENLQIIRYEQPIERWKDQLFDGIDASLTLARSAVAQTGSLILWPTPAEPRLMSLVPSLHFVLLDVDTIHADFYSAMTAEGWATGMPTNALLICGPSKTADIQQTLAYGAHGPRELVVLLRCAPGAAT
jgi:L-lactate dehydrogenase complex protein LldG